MDPELRGSFLAALLAGAGVLVAFHVWHWNNIAPVWRVLVEGAVGVVVAALAVSWAWRLSRRAGCFGGAWGGLAFGALFAGGLLVGALIGRARGPLPNPETAVEIALALPFVLVPVALVAAAGWWLARGWRTLVAYVLCGLVLLVYLGGSIVQRGAEGLGWSLLVLLVPTYLLAGVAIGWLAPRLSRA